MTQTDNAAGSAPPSFARRGLFVTILICLTPIVSHSFGRSVYGLLLPAIEDDLGLSHAEAGLPGTGIYVMYIAGVLLVAVFAPRTEPINIMRSALALGVVGLAIASLATDIFWLTVGVSLVGGSGAGIWLTAPVLVTTYVSASRRGAVIGLLSAAIGLSNIVLGLGTGQLRRTLNDETAWRPIWVFALIFTAGLLVALIGFARFPRTAKVSGGFNLEALRRLPGWVRVTVAYALFGGISAGFNSFILAALEDGDLSRNTTTSIFSLMGVAIVLTAPTLGALSDRFGRPTLLSAASGILIVSNLLVAFGTGWTVAGGAILFSCASGSVPALIAAHLRDHVDNRQFSRVLATMTILFSIVASITPGAVGWLADSTGSFQQSYLLLAVLACGALVLFLTLPSKTSVHD